MSAVGTFTATIHDGDRTTDPDEGTASVVSRRFTAAADAWNYLADWRVSIEDAHEDRGASIIRDVEPLMRAADADEPDTVWMEHPAHPDAPGHTFTVHRES